MYAGIQDAIYKDGNVGALKFNNQKKNLFAHHFINYVI